MNSPAKIVALLTATLLAGTAAAQWGSVPSPDVDPKTQRIQTKVESLYVQGDYQRAHFIYMNELAPVGDKYAQYMVGYMYLMGQGVEEDAVLASAWYRLAAERGAAEFEAVRDKLLAGFDESQLERSDALYLDLRGRHGDVLLVMKEYERELEQYRSSGTGSRLPGPIGPATIVDPRTGVSVSRDVYKSRVMARLQSYLDYIAQKLSIETPEGELSDAEIAALRDRIRAYLSVVNDR